MIKITFKWGEVAPAYLAACLHSRHRKLVHDLSSASSDIWGVCSVWHQHMERLRLWLARVRVQRLLNRSGGEGRGGEAGAPFHVVRSLPRLLSDNYWHLIWRRSNTQSIFTLPIRRTICCYPGCLSLNLIFFCRNQVLIVHLTHGVTVRRE